MIFFFLFICVFFTYKCYAMISAAMNDVRSCYRLVPLVSLATGKPVNPDLAMTGELSLLGRVLPVGGIKARMYKVPYN